MSTRVRDLGRRSTGLMEEFKKFALRGNVMDLAVGFIVGAAFTTVVRSLVDDIIMPPIGLLIGGLDLSQLFILLRAGTPAPPYATVAQAQEAGAVTMNVGLFLNNLISFIIVAFAVFLMVRALASLQRKEEEQPEAATKPCPYCFTTIDGRATRCPECTSELPEAAPAAVGGES